MVSDNGIITASGYGPLAIILAIIYATLMLVALGVVCFLRLKLGMSLAGNNSFAMSAVCHPPPDDKDATPRPLMWGAAKHRRGNVPGHCCFTSFEVERPKIEGLYA